MFGQIYSSEHGAVEKIREVARENNWSQLQTSIILSFDEKNRPRSFINCRKTQNINECN